MIILLALVPVIILAGVLTLIWFRMRARGFFAGEKQPGLPFRFRYIMGPMVLLGIYIVMAAIFYNMLPDGQIAYHFLTDGTPDSFAGRPAVVTVGLAIQVVFVLIGAGIVFAVSRSGFLAKSEDAIIKPETLLTFMGNVLVLPQVILLFAMGDIFSYNAYQNHPLPLWLFAVIILAIATIGFFFLMIFYVIRANRQNRP